MDLKKGDLLQDRYLIESVLGQGGMGAVYLAYDQHLEQKVAVKINRDPSEQSSKQFLKEAQLLAGLRHTRLPRVIDYFITGMDEVLVMDFIPGTDLSELIKNEGAQPLEKIMTWLEQLGDALMYMHTQKPPVVHRDIKPGNIKLTPDGEIVLVDFGIAKASELTQVTATGATGYTPGFAPPEQMSGGRTGPYSDQYSLAATIYQLLSGKQPEDGVQRGLGKLSLTPIKSLMPLLPNHVETALTRALSLRPEDRYKDIADFIQAMKDPTFIPEGGPVITSPHINNAQRKRKSMRLAWVLGIAGGGLVLALLAGGGFYFIPPMLEKLAWTSTPTINVESFLSTEVMAANMATKTQMDLSAGQTATALIPTSTSTPDKIPLGGGAGLAFVSDRADGHTLQIWTMNVYLDNRSVIVHDEPLQLTFDEGDKSEPAWSPDGRQIAFVSPGGPGKGLDIWIMNADGSNPFDLTNKAGDELDPAWSPDGTFIAYTKPNMEGSPLLYYIQKDGRGVHLLGETYQQSQPTWSMDMQWLVYVMSAQNHDYLYMRSIRQDYLTPVPFDLDSLFGRLGEVAHPVFSPDGQWIAYTRMDPKNSYICTVGFTSRGADIQQLTTSGQDVWPTWSTDNHWIAFSSMRDGNPEIYVMTSTGQFQERLTDNPARDVQPAWKIR